jgi:hypothetical protein
VVVTRSSGHLFAQKIKEIGIKKRRGFETSQEPLGRKLLRLGIFQKPVRIWNFKSSMRTLS